jgi:hypothetical protein
MKRLKKFSHYINEGRGIPNIIKNYTDIIFDYIQFDINNNINDDLIIDLENNDLYLKNLFINYKISDRYYGLFNPVYTQFENNILTNVEIVLEIDKNDNNSNKIKEIITHELTHVYEYYNISKTNNKLNIKVNPKYLAVRKSINNTYYNNNMYNFFKYLIYCSLDTEYNARISQLYQFIKKCNSLDKEAIYNKIMESDTYKTYLLLDDFNSEFFVSELIKKIGLKASIYLINQLNNNFIENNVNKLNGYNFIKIIPENLISFNTYMLKWEKIFKQKNKKHRKKISKIIDEVINDLSNGGDKYKENFITEDMFTENNNYLK